MNIDELREYCLKKAGVTEDFPFDQETLAIRVEGKTFLLCNIYEDPLKVNLKCDPGRAIELREQYSEVQPGYHMNKKHWNTVTLSLNLPQNFICELIDHSYELVVRTLPTAKRELIG